MTDEANKKGPESTRRKFLTATTALAGAALAGLPGVAEAERKRNPKRGGTVRFGTRDDSVGLDTHRNFIYFVSQPMAGTTGGLLDFDAGMNIVARHRHRVGAVEGPQDLDLQAAPRCGVPQRRDDRRQCGQVEHRAHPRSQDRPFLQPLGADRRRPRHGRRQVHRAVSISRSRVRPSIPTWSTTRSTSSRPAPSTRPTPSRWAAGRSSSSRGSASTSASWCASRTSGRPIRRATRCPISTA